MNDLIGFFDSGMGGLSVLKTALRLMPNEHYLYYGDNGNAPYGSRPEAEIRVLCEAAIDRLLARNVKAVVIACNTATSVYAETLRSRVSIPVVAMEPALKPAHEARQGGKILVLATKATLSLPKFQKLMAAYGSGAIPIVGEGLVELVESGKADTPEAEETLRKLLAPYLDRQVDSLVLGCTHYPFLIRPLRRLFPNADIFDGREGTVRRLQDLLQRGGLLSDGAVGSVELQTSGDESVLARMRALLNP